MYYFLPSFSPAFGAVEPSTVGAIEAPAIRAVKAPAIGAPEVVPNQGTTSSMVLSPQAAALGAPVNP